MAELERCIEFVHELDRRCAERELPSHFGVALLHRSLPRVWSRNLLVANRNLGEASAELLAAETDRLLGAAGLRHRKVEIHDGEAGARFEPGFRALGWTIECDLVMPHRNEPDRDRESSRAEEVGLDALQPVWEEGIRSEPFARDDDEVVRQLVANKRVVTEAVETRFFAARVNGEIASYCDLYSDGRTGQIEAVMTLARYRNRGLARAVVLHALAASREAGNDLTFLLALRDDWPKELYRKLGFAEAGRIFQFIRPAI